MLNTIKKSPKTSAVVVILALAGLAIVGVVLAKWYQTEGAAFPIMELTFGAAFISGGGGLAIAKTITTK